MAVISYRDAVRGALRDEMLRDQRVILMGESITGYGGSYAVTKGLIDEFGPKRVMETPIAEAGIVGFAVGTAMGGLLPVAELMTVNFALLALDQIVNSAAKFHYMFGGQWSVPLVIRTVSGFGQLGPTHSQTFEGWFASVPGLKVVMPSTPADARGLLLAAIRDPDPVIFIEHSLLYSTKGLASILAGGLAAELFEKTGTWNYAFYGSAALALLAALGSIALRKMPLPHKEKAEEPLAARVVSEAS